MTGRECKARNRLGRGRKGLTIVEIILSIVIIAISSIILVRVFISAASLNDRARMHTQAVMSVVSALDLIGDEEYRLLLQGEESAVLARLAMQPANEQHSGYQVLQWEGKDLFKLVVTFDWDTGKQGSPNPSSSKPAEIPEISYLLARATVFDVHGKEVYAAEKRVYSKWEEKGETK